MQSMKTMDVPPPRLVQQAALTPEETALGMFEHMPHRPAVLSTKATGDLLQRGIILFPCIVETEQQAEEEGAEGTWHTGEGNAASPVAPASMLTGTGNAGW
jgi:hypothetical protein